MPNWCECELYVRTIESPESTQEVLNNFKKHAEQEHGENTNVLSTEKFIPYPEKFREMDRICKVEEDKWEKSKPDNYNELTEDERSEWLKNNPSPWQRGIKDGFNSGGHKWCCENWGTKWGICDAHLSYEDDLEIHYDFSTAWSPPLPLILKMSEMFPLLEFQLRYFECGCCFNGIYICQGGEVTKDEDGPYFGHRGG